MKKLGARNIKELHNCVSDKMETNVESAHRKNSKSSFILDFIIYASRQRNVGRSWKRWKIVFESQQAKCLIPGSVPGM